MEHSSYREQAIRDVAEACGVSVDWINITISHNPTGGTAFAVTQRERVLALEGALRELKNAVDECSLGISSHEEGVALFTAMEQADELLAADKGVNDAGNCK